MRNFAVLGASALVLALGIGQALAIPTTEQWQDHLSGQNSGFERSVGFQDYRAQAVGSFVNATDEGASLYHKGR